jgi:hypothetical protein
MLKHCRIRSFKALLTDLVSKTVGRSTMYVLDIALIFKKRKRE